MKEIEWVKITVELRSEGMLTSATSQDREWDQTACAVALAGAVERVLPRALSVLVEAVQILAGEACEKGECASGQEGAAMRSLLDAVDGYLDVMAGPAVAAVEAEES